MKKVSVPGTQVSMNQQCKNKRKDLFVINGSFNDALEGYVT
jgi:hypothetical protein